MKSTPFVTKHILKEKLTLFSVNETSFAIGLESKLLIEGFRARRNWAPTVLI